MVIPMEMTQCMVVTISLEQMMAWALGRLGQEGMRGLSAIFIRIGRSNVNTGFGRG